MTREIRWLKKSSKMRLLSPFLIIFKQEKLTEVNRNFGIGQRYTYKVLQTIQMKLILLCVWAEGAVLGSAKTALKFKFET